MTDRNPDDELNGNRMIDLLRSFGLTVSAQRDRLGTYVLSAVDEDWQ